MKKIALIFYVLALQTAAAQNVEITYKVNENTNDPVLSTSLDYTLILKNQQSVYYNNNEDLNQFKYQSFIEESRKIGELIMVKLSDNHYAYAKQDLFYKNYDKDTLIYNEIILNKKIFVGEQIKLMKWDILSKSDTLILGFKCQKAVAPFRGRTYEAYFSTELGQYGGPWKFDGLPGVILSVKSQDNYFVIEPLKILKNPKKENEIFNAYEGNEIVSWDEYKSTYKEKLIQQLKKMKAMSENGEGGSIEITDKIEDIGFKKISF